MHEGAMQRGAVPPRAPLLQGQSRALRGTERTRPCPAAGNGGPGAGAWSALGRGPGQRAQLRCPWCSAVPQNPLVLFACELWGWRWGRVRAPRFSVLQACPGAQTLRACWTTLFSPPPPPNGSAPALAPERPRARACVHQLCLLHSPLWSWASSQLALREQRGCLEPPQRAGPTEAPVVAELRAGGKEVGGRKDS